MKHVLTFSDIEIDTKNFSLLIGGEEVALEPLIFDLIVFLANHPDTLISKDQLLENVWRGRIVSDTTIASAIKQARRVLGDDGQQQKYIQTIRGRGFRFVGWEEKVDIEAAGKQALGNEHRGQSQDAEPCLLILPFIVDFAENERTINFNHLRINLERVLSRIPLLRISADTATYSKLGVMPSPRQIYAETGATYLLEGHAEQHSDRLQLVIQLTDNKAGLRIWSEQFSFPTVADHNELIMAIVRKLEPQLNLSIYSSTFKSEGKSGYRSLYLQANGLLALKGWHADTFDEAALLLRECIDKKQDFAYASAYLSLLLAFGHRIGLFEGREQVVVEAAKRAEHALSLAPQDSTIMGNVGCAFCDIGQSERGVPLLKKAIALNESNGQAWVALGAAHLLRHQHDLAIEFLSKGVDISPADGRLSVWRSLLALAYMLSLDIKSALQQAELACQDDDKTYMARLVLSAAKMMNKDRAGAVRAFDDALRIKPDLSDSEIDALLGEKIRRRLKMLE